MTFYSQSHFLTPHFIKMKLEDSASLKKNCVFRILGALFQITLHYLALVTIQIARRHTKSQHKQVWLELVLESLN